MSESKLETDPHARVPGFLPILLFTSACSVVLSMSISNYAGMALAVLSIVLAILSLKNATRKSWNWVIGLSSVGFFLGFTALIMKVIVDANS